MKKKIILLTLIVMLMANVVTYADVPTYQKDPVFRMKLLDIIPDSLEDMDVLKNDVTREEFSEIIFNVYSFVTKKTLSDFGKINSFTDTDNPKIIALHKLGVVNGTSDKTFSPEAKITREQMATMLVRTVDKINPDFNVAAALPVYKDENSISNWAKSSVHKCGEYGLLSGVGSNMFSPKTHATVGQVIIVSDRLYQLCQSDVYSVDNKTKKYGAYDVPLDNKSGIQYSRKEQSGIMLRIAMGEFEGDEIKDINLQIIDMYKSLKNREDFKSIIKLVDLVQSSWSEVNMSFEFGKEYYIKSGVVSEVKPNEKPYIHVQSDGLLYIDVVK